MIPHLLRALFAVPTLAAAGLAQQVLWVDANSGDDAFDGSSPSSAKSTIQGAIIASAAGDTINVLPGTYTGSIVIDHDLRLEARPTAMIAVGLSETGITLDGQAGLTNFTEIKNFEFVGPEPLSSGFAQASTGIFVDLSGPASAPAITNNRFANLRDNIMIRSSGDLQAIHQPTIRHNTINGEEEGEDSISAFGIQVVIDDDTGDNFTAATIEANELRLCSQGIQVVGFGQNSLGFAPTTPTRVQNNTVWRSGITAESYDSGIVFVTNETIVQDIESPLGVTSGIIEIDATVNLSIVNSIIWVAGANNDLRFNGGVAVASHCLTEDGVAGVGNITGNPKFKGVTEGKLRLKNNSPAIDAGDSVAVWPGAPLTPLAIDNRGAPRITDGLRTGTLAVDIGAHEFSPANLFVLAQADVGVFDSSKEPLVDAPNNSTLQITVRGKPGDVAFLTIAPSTSATNAMVNPLGNVLVAPVNTPTFLTLDQNGETTVSLFVSGATEDEFLIQASVLDPATPPGSVGNAPGQVLETLVYLGNMTRAVAVEIN